MGNKPNWPEQRPRRLDPLVFAQEYNCDFIGANCRNCDSWKEIKLEDPLGRRLGKCRVYKDTETHENEHCEGHRYGVTNA